MPRKANSKPAEPSNEIKEVSDELVDVPPASTLLVEKPKRKYVRKAKKPEISDVQSHFVEIQKTADQKIKSFKVVIEFTNNNNVWEPPVISQY